VSSTVDGTTRRTAEHLESGTATHFSDWNHLRRFVEQVLAQNTDEPPPDTTA
jgi:hypothetical protein